MKIALACTGLGEVNRGFEIFFQTLFQELRGEVPLTLFKGRGRPEPGVRVCRNISRHSRLWSGVGLRQENFMPRYVVEQLSFGLAFLPALVRGRYDVVHVSEYHLGRFLLALKLWRRRPRIVLHNGHPLPPAMVKDYDHVQQLTQPRYLTGIAAGIPEHRMSLLPIGVRPGRFSGTTPGRNEMRARLGVPEDHALLISVGAVNRWHKRMDWLIREVSRIGPAGKVRLLILGNREEESEPILRMGREALGERVRFLQVGHHEVPAYYRAADLFVLCSLYEGFGIAFIEAMAAGLPVLTHRVEDFGWIAGEAGLQVDMEEEGALARTVLQCLKDPGQLKRMGEKGQERVRGMFSWDVLVPRYVRMYERLASRR
jgi:1,2-diacylglycerol 3-alpha-glucosyltransferase